MTSRTFDNMRFYQHPTYVWLWFALSEEGEYICYTGRDRNREKQLVDFSTPRKRMLGCVKDGGPYGNPKDRIIKTSYKGTIIKIDPEIGYKEAKSGKATDDSNFENFLNSIKREQIQRDHHHLEWELFDFPLPAFYKKEQQEIDYTKIQELPSGLWTALIDGQKVGATEDPLEAYRLYLSRSKK